MSTNANNSEQYPELQAQWFAVGDAAYCVWDWDLDKKNLEFLESTDPGYFKYVAEANYPHLDTDDAEENQRAATAIRMAYHHGLESLFAMIFASLQAPYCAVGWMQTYSPAQLRKLAKTVGLSWSHSEREEMKAYRERVLAYMWIEPRELVSWKSVSAELIKPTGDKDYVDKVQELFGNLWGRLARDLIKDSFVDEYNSIKHGLRTGPGGFSFAMGPEEVPGKPSVPKKMRTIAASEHGSSFFVRRAPVEDSREKEQRAAPRDRNFRVRRQNLNWDPKTLAQSLALISISIHNVRARVLSVNGVDVSDLKFQMLPEEAFNTQGRGRESSFTNFDFPVVQSDIEVFGKGELKRRVAQAMSQWRDKRREERGDNQS
jgi:hypothetical protein